FTEPFQDLITRYAWGEIWTRPGLGRRTRSCMVLTALVAQGHWNEAPMHVRAALRNGLSPDEIGEVFLQSAVCCGVPAANKAFALAQEVFDEERGARRAGGRAWPRPRTVPPASPRGPPAGPPGPGRGDASSGSPRPGRPHRARWARD